MKRLVLLPTLLLLASCAPALQTAQREQASVRIEERAALFVNPGPDVARLPTLVLRDAGTTAEGCARLDARTVACKLADVPAGQQYRVVTDARPSAVSATFYRAASGDRPIFLRAP